jgi:hypothetical protein
MIDALLTRKVACNIGSFNMVVNGSMTVDNFLAWVFDRIDVGMGYLGSTGEI